MYIEKMQNHQASDIQAKVEQFRHFREKFEQQSLFLRENDLAPIGCLQVLQPHKAKNVSELTLNVGEFILLLKKLSPTHFLGEAKGFVGYVLSDFVRELSPQEILKRETEYLSKKNEGEGEEDKSKKEEEERRKREEEERRKREEEERERRKREEEERERRKREEERKRAEEERAGRRGFPRFSMEEDDEDDEDALQNQLLDNLMHDYSSSLSSPSHSSSLSSSSSSSTHPPFPPSLSPSPLSSSSPSPLSSTATGMVTVQAPNVAPLSISSGPVTPSVTPSVTPVTGGLSSSQEKKSLSHKTKQRLISMGVVVNESDDDTLSDDTSDEETESRFNTNLKEEAKILDDTAQWLIQEMTSKESENSMRRAYKAVKDAGLLFVEKFKGSRHSLIPVLKIHRILMKYEIEVLGLSRTNQEIGLQTREFNILEWARSYGYQGQAF